MRLVWSNRAVVHLEAAFAHIAEDDPAAAARVIQRIVSLCERLLTEHAEIGRPGRVAGTRELVISKPPYIAAYAVDGETVTILAVLHGARRWPLDL